MTAKNHFHARGEKNSWSSLFTAKKNKQFAIQTY